MSGHTPGPWEYFRGTHSVWSVDRAACITNGPHKRESEERDANARLIAAAPDLLLALREIADDYADRFDMNCPSTNPGIKYVVEQARAVIAKATVQPAGEGEK